MSRRRPRSQETAQGHGNVEEDVPARGVRGRGRSVVLHRWSLSCMGPTGGTLRYDAIAPISFANKRLGLL